MRFTKFIKCLGLVGQAERDCSVSVWVAVWFEADSPKERSSWDKSHWIASEKDWSWYFISKSGDLVTMWESCRGENIGNLHINWKAVIWIGL